MSKKEKIKPITVKDVTIIDDNKMRKAITAASVGNAVEWYDFGVYGFIAYALGKIFFPDTSPSVQLIASLATFSIPFLIRPLGGLFFGMLGDKYGRQKILITTVLIMTISTFGIGLIPSYETIGIWAPILLLLCKIAQGFSVGGEYTGASIFVAEFSPDRKRGFMGSWLDFGSISGFVTGAGVVLLLSSTLGEARFYDWGWRIPFFLSLPLGIFALFLRNTMEDSPIFQQQQEKQSENSASDATNEQVYSFKEIATKYGRSLLTCAGLVVTTNVTYYMLLTYLPSYLTHNLKYSEDHGVMIIVAIMIGMLFIQPIVGLLSDRYGRRPFALFGSIALFVLSIPAFKLINSGVVGYIFIGLLFIAIILNSFTGIMASTIPAMFPTQIRYRAIAITFNISAVIAGMTPTVAAWLVESTNNLTMPAYYLMAVSFIGLLTVFAMKETANRPLRGETPVASDLEEAKEIIQDHHDSIEQKIEDLDVQIAELQEKRRILVMQHPKIND